MVYTIGIILFLTQLLHTSHTLAHHSSVYMAHTPSALASIFLNLLISFASTLAIYSPGHIPEEFIFWNPSFYLILRWWCGGRRWGGGTLFIYQSYLFASLNLPFQLTETSVFWILCYVQVYYHFRVCVSSSWPHNTLLSNYFTPWSFYYILLTISNSGSI